MAGAATVGCMTSGHGGYPPVAIAEGSPTVKINGKPAVRKGDSGVMHTKPKGTIHSVVVSGGSSKVFINGRPAARSGDPCGCGDTIVGGCSSNVTFG